MSSPDFGTPNLPVISVIMPAYNAARFLPDAIESVLNQSYTNLELVLVNDASTDHTTEIVARYQNDPRLVYVDHSKLGSPAKVRNVAIRQAKGEYIAFLDADDRYYVDALAQLMAKLQNGCYEAVQGVYQSMDEHSQPLGFGETLITNIDGTLAIPDHLYWTPEKLLIGNLNCLLPTVLIKKSLFEAVGYFDETLPATEDYDFFIRLFTQYGNRYQRVPVLVYDYRIYANSITRDARRANDVLQSNLMIVEKVFKTDYAKPYQHLKSKAHIGNYKFMARERINVGRTKEAQEIIGKCWQNPQIHWWDKVTTCSQLWLRSLLPTGFNQHLSLWVRQTRLRLQTQNHGA